MLYDFWEVPIPRSVRDDQRQAIVGPEPGQERDFATRIVWWGRKGAAAKLRKEGLKT